MAFTSLPEQSGLARSLYIALFLCLLLLGYGLIRYRGMLVFSGQGLLFAGLLLLLTLIFAAYAFLGREISEGFGREEMWAQRQGMNFGLLVALFWVAEVVVDNIIPTFNLVIAIACIVGVLVVQFIAGVYGAQHTRSFSFGLRIGLWSGMLSSLIAWIVLLVLTYILMPQLQGYSRYMQGFAHSGTSDIMTYIVKNAISAATGYLVIGPVMGLAFGALGALVGKFFAGRKSVVQSEE